MNRWFEFRVNADFRDDSLTFWHTKCGWTKWLSTADDGSFALDMLMKCAQDHLDLCGGEAE